MDFQGDVASSGVADPQSRLTTALQHRHNGRLQDATALLEDAIEFEGDSDVLWGELATTQWQQWQQHMSRLHKKGANSSSQNGECGDQTQAQLQGINLGGSILQETYNTFLIAMEYPNNKKNPKLLIKLAILYVEFHAYPGALSVCTLLIEAYASEQTVLHEAIFLSAVAAHALKKPRESAQYFQYLVEKPPFRLHAYQLHLLAALKLDHAVGKGRGTQGAAAGEITREHVRETFIQAYKAMIALSPVTASEKAAHALYKSSHKNESQRVQAWYLDKWTWFDFAKRLSELNFPLMACLVLDIAHNRILPTVAAINDIPEEMVVIEAVCRYRAGETDSAVKVLADALLLDRWSLGVNRSFLQSMSSAWAQQFELEERSARRIQRFTRSVLLRTRWRCVKDGLLEVRRHKKALMLQCAWRQHIARKRLEDCRQYRREQENDANATMATHDELIIMKTLNAAAVVIQSLQKIYCAKRERQCRRMLKIKHNTLVVTFAVRRSSLCLRQFMRLWNEGIVTQRFEQNEAAVTLQRVARQFLSRAILKRLLHNKQRCDSILRACLDRRSASSKHAIIMRWKQGVAVSRQEKQQAASRIQGWRRCHVARRSYHLALHRHRVATGIMQQLIADKTVRRLRIAWRAFAVHALWQRQRKRNSATIIQKHFRGLLGRRLARHLLARRRRAERVIAKMRRRSDQHLQRFVLAAFRSHAELQWSHRYESAITIQRVYRGVRARKRIRVLKECRHFFLGGENATSPNPTRLRGQPRVHVLRVCFLVLAAIPEQNRVAARRSGLRIQRWYRFSRWKQRFLVTLRKRARQRALMAKFFASFRVVAALFFSELKTHVAITRWRRDRAARHIQREMRNWLTYRRYMRVLERKADRDARVVLYSQNKRSKLIRIALSEWRRAIRLERSERESAVLAIQRSYRTRIARRQARGVVAKRAMRAHLLETIHLKPLEQAFRQWEATLMQRSVLTVRSAARSGKTPSRSSEKRSMYEKTDKRSMGSSNHTGAALTLEQRAAIPSLAFYTLLNRVRQSGILQFSFSGGIAFTIPHLHQLLAFATSVIVDGGGVRPIGAHRPPLVEQVVDALDSCPVHCPVQKLILYNASLDIMHATALSRTLTRNGSISSLVLSNIRMSSTSVATLATSLCHGQSRLEQLVLEACAIGNAGAAALLEALSHTQRLWKLDLSRNHLSDSICALLSSALLTNRSLRVLVLNENALSDRGVLVFLAPTLARMAQLAPPSRLEALSLRGQSRVSSLGWDALHQAASRFNDMMSGTTATAITTANRMANVAATSLTQRGPLTVNGGGI